MPTDQYSDSLFYKDHRILGKDIEIFFHKNIPCLSLNEEEEYPVTKFTLTNYRNLKDLNFDELDNHFDGITIEVYKDSELTRFCMSEIDGTEFNIICDKVLHEDLDYRKSDLIDIIKSVKKESEENHRQIRQLLAKLDRLTTSLEHDLEILNRKIAEAGWLTTEKKKFLEGQRLIVQKELQYIKNTDDKVEDK